MIKLKRVYDPAEADDGERVLVDRLWPRGISKERAHLSGWAKALAPSTELRVWYHAHYDQWEEFRKRYKEELRPHQEALTELAEKGEKGTLTLLYSVNDRERNHAVILREALLATRG